MVASGVASKGLDFSEIQHVINFTMPKEIEVRSFAAALQDNSQTVTDAGASHTQDYVHQCGRTGRGDKTGIATTFVNMQTPEQTLLDLKYLLMEAKQKCALFPHVRRTPTTEVLTLGLNAQSPALPALDRRPEHWCGRQARGLHQLRRSGSHDPQLPEARGEPAADDGWNRAGRRQRRRRVVGYVARCRAALGFVSRRSFARKCRIATVDSSFSSSARVRYVEESGVVSFASTAPPHSPGESWLSLLCI